MVDRIPKNSKKGSLFSQTQYQIEYTYDKTWNWGQHTEDGKRVTSDKNGIKPGFPPWSQNNL